MVFVRGSGPASLLFSAPGYAIDGIDSLKKHLILNQIDTLPNQSSNSASYSVILPP
jgi:hypothetical protein